MLLGIPKGVWCDGLESLVIFIQHSVILFMHPARDG